MKRDWNQWYPFCRYLKNANGVIVTYDVTNRTSFERVAFWRRLVESCDSIESDLVYILIGNKTDLADLRAVTSQEGLQQAGTSYNQYFCKITFSEICAVLGWVRGSTFLVNFVKCLINVWLTLINQRVLQCCPKNWYYFRWILNDVCGDIC